MNKDKLISEIQILNAQLAAIEEEEEQDTTASLASDDEEIQNDLVSEIYTQIESGLKLDENTKKQLKKLVKEVELQFEQLPKTACMSIFTAGIILGKVLK